MKSQTPDYRYILIRLLEKISRNRRYYLAIAEAQERKSRRRDLSPRQSEHAAARALTLRKNASDLEYMIDRSMERLDPQDIADIKNFDRQEIYDRSHSAHEPERTEDLRSSVRDGQRAEVSSN